MRGPVPSPPKNQTFHLRTFRFFLVLKPLHLLFPLPSMPFPFLVV